MFSGSPIAQTYTLRQAKAVAMTALDVFCQPSLLDTIKAEFAEAMERAKHE